MALTFTSAPSYLWLNTWVLANIIELSTQSFCNRFIDFRIDPGRRLYDQMTQAARSIRANIAEGSGRHDTSLETEMRLTDVARASSHELLGDFLNYMMRHSMTPWPTDDIRFKNVIEFKLAKPVYSQNFMADAIAHIKSQKSRLDIYLENGTSMPRNMFLFTNANYLLPYTGAGSGVRRALEYDPDVTFSNGINDREITHSANEFVITIPRKSEQVTNQANLVTDPAQTKTDQAQTETDPASPKSEQPTNQEAQNTTKLAQNTDPALAQTDPVSDQPHSKTDPVHSGIDPVSDLPHSKTDPVHSGIDPVSDQSQYNKLKLKLSKKQQDIRNYCSIPRNRQEILQRASVSDHFYNRKKYIYDLVEAGVLERTIPNKPNEPNQKYRRKQ